MDGGVDQLLTDVRAALPSTKISLLVLCLVALRFGSERFTFPLGESSGSDEMQFTSATDD
jgi:hypothetical protein